MLKVAKKLSQKKISKTFVSIILCVAMTLVLTVVFISVRFFKIAEDMSVSLLQDNNATLVSELSYHISFVNEIATQFTLMIFNDSTVRSVLSATAAVPDELAPITMINRIQQELIAIEFGESVLLYNGTTGAYYATDYNESNGNKDLVSFFENNYAQETFYLLPRVIASDDPNGAFKEVFTYVLLERDNTTQKITMAIALDIDKDQLLSELSLTREDGINNFMLVRTDGRVLLSGENNFYQTQYLDQDFMAALSEYENEVFGYTILGADCVVANQYIENSDWFFVNIQQSDAYLPVIFTLRNELIWAMFFAFLIAVPVTLFFARKIYNPIHRMVNQASKMAKASQLENLPKWQADELKYMDAFFDAQHKQLQTLEQQKWLQLEQNKKANIKMAVLDSGTNFSENLLKNTNHAFALNDQLLAVLLVLNHFDQYPQNGVKERNLVRYAVANIAEELMEPYGIAEVISIQSGSFVLFVKPHAGRNQLEQADEICRAIRDHIQDIFKISMSAFLDETVWRSTKLHQTYARLQHFSKYTLLYGAGVVLSVADLAEQDAQPLNYPQELEKKLLQQMIQANAQQSQEVLQAFFNAMLQQSVQSYLYCCKNLLNAYQALVEKVNENKLEKIEPPFATLFAQIDAAETSDEIFYLFSELTLTIIASIPYNTERKNTIVAENIKQFVDENYADQALCLKSLSTKFNISTGYLNTTFKSIYGFGVQKYINTVRLHYAEDLIAHTNYPIAKVVEKCGLETSSFYRLYKATFGISPKEQRLSQKTEPEKRGEAEG